MGAEFSNEQDGGPRCNAILPKTPSPKEKGRQGWWWRQQQRWQLSKGFAEAKTEAEAHKCRWIAAKAGWKERCWGQNIPIRSELNVGAHLLLHVCAQAAVRVITRQVVLCPILAAGEPSRSHAGTIAIPDCGRGCCKEAVPEAVQLDDAVT